MSLNHPLILYKVEMSSGFILSKTIKTFEETPMLDFVQLQRVSVRILTVPK